MQAVLFGGVAGFLLSCLRAPLGLSLIEIPAVEPRHALGYRALALAVLAAGLWVRGAAPLRLAHFLACALGFAIHGWLIAPSWSPGSHFELLLSAAVALAALLVLGRREAGASADERSGGFERLGWLISGAGAAFGLELIARQLRLHGQQLSDNDTHYALTLILLMGLGGSAFAWLAERPGLRRSAPMLLMALFALCLYGSVSMQQRTASAMPLREYLASFGLDLSLHGTLPFDALLSASLFVLPAFALGTALRALKDGAQLASLCLGAALGMLLCLQVGREASGGKDVQTYAMQWIPLAAGLSGGGAVVALLSLNVKSSLSRWLQIAGALACHLPIALVEITPAHVLSPWSRTPVAPYQLRETPGGFLTLEGPLLPDAMTGNVKQLTLERRVLVPGFDSVLDEWAMIDASLALRTPAQLAAPEQRALIIGQLTPLRARRLSKAGFTEIDRSATWWRVMDKLEQEYFGESPKPAGSILEPAAALAALGAGRYTLVIVPPVRGAAPRLPSLTPPSATTVVVWLHSATPLAGGAGPGVLHLGPSKIDQPLFARVFGPMNAAASRFEKGASGSHRPLSWLWKRDGERDTATRADNFRRIAARQQDHFSKGLELLYAAQERSSPFENPAESFELPTAALDELQQAPLDPTLRFLWEEIGIVLSGKRWIPQLYQYLEPLVARHAPWPELERQLAVADAESLEFESALRRLLPIQEAFARNSEYWRELGKIQEQLEKGADSIASFRKALELRPEDHDLERRLALQLVRAGDPEGPKRVQKLLAEHPDDEELQLFAGPGPYPAPKRGYSPQGRRHDH